MTKRSRKKTVITALILFAAIVLAAGLFLLRRRNRQLASVIYGDFGERVNFTMTVSGRSLTVKGYYAANRGNTYLSLRDIAGALSGTEKHFNVEHGPEKLAWQINTSRNYVNTTKKENTAFFEAFPGAYSGTNEAQGRDGLLLFESTVTIDGDDSRICRLYYQSDNKGDPVTTDAYIGLMDIGLLLDLDLEFTSETDFNVNPDRGFIIDLDRLEKAEYFHDLDGVILGNCTTGEILYAWDAVHQTEIASTSKLMTWLLVQEAIANGRLTLQSTYKISDNVMRLCASVNGKDVCRANWSVGKEVTVKDLIAGMLLPSSNECAVALAEATMLSYGFTEDLEKHFVQKMNDRAFEMGLTSAMFYNASGLPQYEADQISAKRGNKMSANDLYMLSAYIMNYWRDEFTAFSAEQAMLLESFGNGVWAVSSYYDRLSAYAVNGMKTGTTDRAENCIVASMDVKVNGEIQTVIAIVLGAETQKLRYEQTSVLLAYARQYYK